MHHYVGGGGGTCFRPFHVSVSKNHSRIRFIMLTNPTNIGDAIILFTRVCLILYVYSVPMHMLCIQILRCKLGMQARLEQESIKLDVTDSHLPITNSELVERTS